MIATKVNYSSFNSSQVFLDEYENKTSSLSTNTGGNCQFYKSVIYSKVLLPVAKSTWARSHRVRMRWRWTDMIRFVDCNNKGDDRGVTLSYNYNLNETTDDYGGDYDNQISSCKIRLMLSFAARSTTNMFHREMLR